MGHWPIAPDHPDFDPLARGEEGGTGFCRPDVAYGLNDK